MNSTLEPQDFETLLDSLLSERAAEPPTGLQQRLLARIQLQAETSFASTENSKLIADHCKQHNAPAQPLFTSAVRMKPQRSAAAAWTALTFHAVGILLLVVLFAKHSAITMPKLATTTHLAPPPIAFTETPRPRLAPRKETLGGGGGHHDIAPVTVGHPPLFATQQITPPKAPTLLEPRLAVEPTFLVQKNLRFAAAAPDLGLPASSLHGQAFGLGYGTGLGGGDGAGLGSGAGSNLGGGYYHIGGDVSAPTLTREVPAEFTEEARKAKFSGNVEVYLIVDERGNPTHVRVSRDAGMGLGEKAVDAVRQYKFKPALKDGKPVKVDLYIDVDFQIF